MFFLSGCSWEDDGLKYALQLRSDLQASSGSTFDANITADYGDVLYHFFLKCQTQDNGDLKFTVIEPETISGITGTISQDGGKILFEDKALFFEEVSQTGITPVAAPWFMLKALKSGYIKGAGKTDSGTLVQIDDSYLDSALNVNLNLDHNHLPYFAEMFYNNRRIMSIEIENFVIM